MEKYTKMTKFVILVLVSSIASVSSINLESGLRMAYCRTKCLKEFNIDPDLGEECRSNNNCGLCWSTCEKLSVNYPIWKYNCGRKSRCNDGCQYACQIVNKTSVVPLSNQKTMLNLSFKSKSADWSLTLGDDVSPQNVVYSLFTRIPGRSWKLRTQTVRHRTSLQDVSVGTELKLIAVGVSGLLSVIITPFIPPCQENCIIRQTKSSDQDNWTVEKQVIDSKSPKWKILYQASLQKSGMIAVRFWWNSGMEINTDYLVTWEVAGGGLKGHLYTEVPSVELTLLPETVYKVQVEVTSRSSPTRSFPLYLNTHNITDMRTNLPYHEQHIPSERVQLPDYVNMVIYTLVGICLAFIALFMSLKAGQLLYKNCVKESSCPKDADIINKQRPLTSLYFENDKLCNKLAAFPPQKTHVTVHTTNMPAMASIAGNSQTKGNLYVKYPISPNYF